MFPTDIDFDTSVFKSLFKKNSPGFFQIMENINLAWGYHWNRLEETKRMAPVSRSNFSISGTCKSRGWWLKMTYVSVFNQWQIATHFFQIHLIIDHVCYFLKTMICIVRLIHWIRLLTRFDNNQMVYIFLSLFFISDFLYFVVLNSKIH